MNKATTVGKDSIKGSFHLLWGLIISTVFSGIGAIILALVLGETDYGIYAVVLSAPNFIGIFKDLGINSAVTYYIVKFNLDKNSSDIKALFISGFIIKIVIGLFLSLLCFSLSNYLAINVFQRPTIGPLIQVVSLVILAQGLINTATAVFAGIEKMHLNSVMIISQSLIRATVSPILVLIGLATYGAIIGFTLAYIIAAAIGLLLIWAIYRDVPKLKSGLDFRRNVCMLLRFGLPLSLSNILSGFLTQFYAFVLAILVLNNAQIGNYNVATNFLVLISFISIPITTMLFPAFSKINPSEHETLKNVFQYSVKYTSLFVVPLSIMLIALSQPAVSTIFGNTFSEAPLFLSLLSLPYLFCALGNYSTNNLINSQKQARIKLILAAATVATGIPMSIIMISSMGVIGLIITNITALIPSVVIGLFFVKKVYNLTIDWLSSGGVILSAVISGILSYLVTIVLPDVSIIRLCVGVILFTITYIFLLIFTRTIKKADIDNLKQMSSGIPMIGKIVLKIIRAIECIITIFQKESADK
jgi:O-antigen/teichoic acid export membrane protein